MRLRSYRPHLPLELIAYIIDCVDSPAALKNCSLVCHAWLLPSRSHIFRVVSVFLHGQAVFKRLQRLNNLLEKSPCILTYVSELYITRRRHWVPMVPSEYRKLSTIVPSLLYKLTNLRKIAVSGIDWTEETTPEIRSAARALIDRPSLVHVRVRSCWFEKLDHLTALLPPTLKRFDISHSWGDESSTSGVIDEENKRYPPQQPCQLEYLDCHVSSALADWLLKSQQFDISNVHTLDVFSVFDESESMSRIVSRLGLSLEHLHFTYSYAPVLFGSIDVSHNPNIKSISFSGPHLTGALHSFKTIMSSLVATNIEQIRFTCKFRLEPKPSGVWEELDGILQSDQFTTLREVEFRVPDVFAVKGPFDVLFQSLSVCLPSVHAREILYLTPVRDNMDVTV